MGPLQGIRIVELTGIGPGPFAAMMLADMGAEVLRVDRAQLVRDDFSGSNPELLFRGRRSVGVDLKNPDGVETVLRLVESADALIEGFRPGVAERLGVGPDECAARNPRLVYGRMTGWGQEGPLATAAGHDINYIALGGALAHIGRPGEKPVPPLNLVGDFGGGGMLLAFGVVCGVLEAGRSGKGQVVDAAMVDGTATLMTLIQGLQGIGMWSDERGTNMLDTGLPYYDTYETADGKYVSIGSLEPQFYAELLEKTGLTGEGFEAQDDPALRPRLRERLTEVFLTKTRDEWCETLEGSDVCFAPVLTMSEAAEHPHAKARGTYMEIDGFVQPSPAPRFGRTTPAAPTAPVWPGENTDEALTDWGFDASDISALRESGAVK
ncbi:MAG: CaiB/BaiF CoA-transferase family protein [Acidimicrobiia bacterium]